jgi:hypothetical protein
MATDSATVTAGGVTPSHIAVESTAATPVEAAMITTAPEAGAIEMVVAIVSSHIIIRTVIGAVVAIIRARIRSVTVRFGASAEAHHRCGRECESHRGSDPHAAHTASEPFS